jgi:hypothetical protein
VRTACPYEKKRYIGNFYIHNVGNKCQSATIQIRQQGEQHGTKLQTKTATATTKKTNEADRQTTPEDEVKQRREGAPPKVVFLNPK